MNNNYDKFSDYQNNYETPKEQKDNEKIVVIEKKKEKDSSIIKEKFRYFSKFHWNELKYTIFGLIIAILFLTIGFFRTLLIILLYNIGNIYGKYKDGDPKTIFNLEKFFNKY